MDTWGWGRWRGTVSGLPWLQAMPLDGELFRSVSKGLGELGLELSQLEGVRARLRPCPAADGFRATRPILMPVVAGTS